MTTIELTETDGPHVTHAIRELELSGQTTEDPLFAASLVNAVRAFTGYGHSGGSASIGIDMLHTLLLGRTLTPIGPEDQWKDVSEASGYPMWQNERDSSAFSNDGGKTHWRVD